MPAHFLRLGTEIMLSIKVIARRVGRLGTSKSANIRRHEWMGEAPASAPTPGRSK
jgi:hypothetical protein